MSRTWKRHLSTLFALLIAVSASAFAQTFRGTVTGMVVDTQGAVIAGASVQLSDPATSLVLDGQIKQRRRVRFPRTRAWHVPAHGNCYRVPDHKIENIDVAVSKVATVKSVLTIGSENTVINVEANVFDRHYLQFAGRRHRLQTSERHADEWAQLYPDDQFTPIVNISELGERIPHGQHQLPGRRCR